MKPVLTNRCAERIIGHASARTRIAASDIIGPSRLRMCVTPRNRVIRIMHRLGYSAGDIGIALNRDGASVRHALRGGRA